VGAYDPYRKVPLTRPLAASPLAPMARVLWGLTCAWTHDNIVVRKMSRNQKHETWLRGQGVPPVTM
jgi:hypothetical protein